jgi:NitT/TauT family transport system substrate-binding protein
MTSRNGFVRLAGAASLAPLLHSAPAAGATTQPLRVLLFPTDGVKTLLWAQQQQLFEHRGLPPIEFEKMASGAAIIPALVGGSGEFGAGSLFPMFAAFARGLPIKLVAPTSLYLSDHADSLLLVGADSPIRTARDMNGKILGVDSLNDVYTLATRAWVSQGGGDGESLKPVEIPAAESFSALVAGRIDAAIFKTPFGSIALSTKKVRLLGKPLDAIAPRFLLSSWIATDSYITGNAQTVNGFQAVVGEASRYTNSHEDATVDLVANFTGQDPAQVRSSVRATSAISVNLAELQRPLDFAARYKLIPQSFDVRQMLAPGFPISDAGSP